MKISYPVYLNSKKIQPYILTFYRLISEKRKEIMNRTNLSKDFSITLNSPSKIGTLFQNPLNDKKETLSNSGRNKHLSVFVPFVQERDNMNKLIQV